MTTATTLEIKETVENTTKKKKSKKEEKGKEKGKELTCLLEYIGGQVIDVSFSGFNKTNYQKRIEQLIELHNIERGGLDFNDIYAEVFENVLKYLKNEFEKPLEFKLVDYPDLMSPSIIKLKVDQETAKRIFNYGLFFKLTDLKAKDIKDEKKDREKGIKIEKPICPLKELNLILSNLLVELEKNITYVHCVTEGIF